VGPSTTEQADQDVVARWEGGELTMGELRGRMGAEIRNMDIQHALRRYEVQLQALDGMIDEALLEAEMTRLGLGSVEELLVQEIEDQVPEPSEAEILENYDRVVAQVPGATLDAARPHIVQDLMQRRLSERYGAYIDALRGRVGVTRAFPYPDLPRADVRVTESDPTLGPDDAVVTIVQFAEYQCYFCNRVLPTLDQLRDTYQGKVRIVFKDFPLQNHTQAMPAAIAAHCAGDQEKYWEYNKTLLANQGALARADLLGYAQSLSMDVDSFVECLDSGRFEPVVLGSMEQGQELGVQATPTFFINGLMLSGAQPYDRFASLIDRELASVSSP
jgi:protein-disulfide isomerase